MRVEVSHRTLQNRIWVSLSFFWFHRERERERERRDTDFACAMTVGCEGLRSERWKVTVRVEIGDEGWRWGLRSEMEAWRARVEIGDGGWRWGLEIGEMEGEGWDQRWRVRVRAEIGDRGLEGEEDWDQALERSMEADVWERLARVENVSDQIVYIQSLKPCF